MIHTRTGRAVVYGALAVSLAGCGAARSAMSGALGGVNRGASDAAGNAAQGAVARRFGGPAVPGMAGGRGAGGAMTGQMMAGYANWMFTLAFNSGGYWVPGSDLRAGESVTFEFSQHDARQRMERAFLTQLPDGKTWFRVKWYSLTEPDTMVFEALFSADKSQVLRMRGKTNGQPAGEIPVEQNTGFSWREPTYLTTESLNAAVVGTESITTPAGTYTAKHVRYSMMGGGTYEWWMAEGVPGGVAKYVVGYGSDSYTQVLVAVSRNATTELGSY
jgi:hypothetical protein